MRDFSGSQIRLESDNFMKVMEAASSVVTTRETEMLFAQAVTALAKAQKNVAKERGNNFAAKVGSVLSALNQVRKNYDQG